MKYKQPKQTIHELKTKNKLPKQKLLSVKILKSKSAHLVEKYFLMEDEDPPIHPILSSVYYSEYSFYCHENEVNPLSRRAFSIIAQKYVTSEKGKHGKMWYTLRPHVLVQLNSKLMSRAAS